MEETVRPMTVVEIVDKNGLPYHDDESGLIRLSILELADSIEKETINRRRDTLNILSTIAGVEDRFADFINVLEERIDELEDRLANHVNVKEVSDDR